MPSPPPKVFISYSHDSVEHEERVLALAERLRTDGVDAQLDQYVAGTPAEYWPRWMLNRLDWADFVLVVCTETYYRRFRGFEQPEKGKGADWEGNLITSEIYDAKSRTIKFAPIFFDSKDERFLPEPIRGPTRYMLNAESNYAKLYAFLTGQAGVRQTELGPLKTLAHKQVEPMRFDDFRRPITHPLLNSALPEESLKLSQSDKRSLSVQLLSRSLQDVCANKVLSNLLFRSVTGGFRWQWRDKSSECLRALECYCVGNATTAFDLLLSLQAHNPAEQQLYRCLWQKGASGSPRSINLARDGWLRFKDSSDTNALIGAISDLLHAQSANISAMDNYRSAFDQDSSRLFSMLE